MKKNTLAIYIYGFNHKTEAPTESCRYAIQMLKYHNAKSWCYRESALECKKKIEIRFRKNKIPNLRFSGTTVWEIQLTLISKTKARQSVIKEQAYAETTIRNVRPICRHREIFFSSSCNRVGSRWKFRP